MIFKNAAEQVVSSVSEQEANVASPGSLTDKPEVLIEGIRVSTHASTKLGCIS